MTSSEAMDYLTKRLNAGNDITIWRGESEYCLSIDPDNLIFGATLADAIERSIAEHGWKYAGD